MLRHSFRCISKRAAICPVSFEPQPTIVKRVARAILDNYSLITFGKTLKRRSVVSLRSFSSTAREALGLVEEVDDQSTETTDEQQPQVLANESSSSCGPDETRELLRSVLKRTGKAEKSNLDSDSALIPFTKPSSELQPDPKEDWPLDKSLRHHIRACLSNIQYESREVGVRDTSLSVCTLGTGAGTGSRARANSATVVKNGGDCYLVDAGEGVTRQYQLSRLDFSSLRKIFSESIIRDLSVGSQLGYFYLGCIMLSYRCALKLGAR